MSLIRQLTPRFVRNYLRNPKASVTWLKDRLAGASGKKSAISMGGVDIFCEPASRRFFEEYTRDKELIDEVDDFLSHMTGSIRFLDIGCHYGLFSLIAAKMNSNHKCLAVDPSDIANKLATANCKINNLTNVTVVHGACADHTGTMEMLSTGPAGEQFFVGTTEQRPDTQTVPCFTLDDLCQKYSFEPSHIKIDIESFEVELLRGNKDFLTRASAILYFELHSTMIKDRGLDPQEVLDILHSCGYSQFFQAGASVNPNQILSQGISRFVGKKS